MSLESPKRKVRSSHDRSLCSHFGQRFREDRERRESETFLWTIYTTLQQLVINLINFYSV